MMAKLVSSWRKIWSVEPGTTDPLAPFGVVSLADGTDESFGINMRMFRWCALTLVSCAGCMIVQHSCKECPRCVTLTLAFAKRHSNLLLLQNMFSIIWQGTDRQLRDAP